MNTNELFALIDDWTETVSAIDAYNDTNNQFDIGREVQLRSCIDQLLAVISVSGLIE